MKYKQIVTIIVVLLLSTTTALAAFESNDKLVSDDFESYDVGSDLSPTYSISGTPEISPFSLEGSQSLEVDGDDTVTLSTSNAISTDRSEPTNITSTLYSTGSGTNQNTRLIVQDGTGQSVSLQFSGFDDGGTGQLSLDTGDNSDLLSDYPQDTWINVTMEMNYTDNQVYVYIDGSSAGSVQWDPVDQWDNDDNLHFRITQTAGGDGVHQMFFDDVRLATDEVISEELAVELQQGEYMEPGETKTYTVTHNQTLVDGTFNSTDVTESTNVTSQNTSLIVVDESSNSLTASNDNSGNVNVTFEYQGLQENVSIFVGPRTIGNIADLPSSQWFAAAMGFDEEGTWYVMGSEIQMVLLAVFIGAATAWKARNEYLGIGVIILAIVLFWTADHVSIGIVMVSVFYGLFAAYQQRETPGRSDTNVNPNGGIDSERFRR